MKYKLLLLILIPMIGIGSNEVNTGHAKVSLVKSAENLIANQSFIGIKFDLNSGWHTYWKNPGDSGGPLEIKWNMPDNLELSQISWPTPHLIPYPPLMTYGYDKEVIFPFKVLNYENTGLDSSIEVSVDFLICADVCIPEKALIKTSINNIEFDSNLIKIQSDIPSTILPVEASINKKTLEIRFSKTSNVSNVYFFSEIQDFVDHAAAQNLIEYENSYLLSVDLLDGQLDSNNIKGLIEIDDSVYLIDSDLILSAEQSNEFGILEALFFAFIGGLILNLMPCVFPVISLKVLSFVSMSGESENKIRLHSLSFSLGVLISFLAIAVLLIVLKESGNYLGWGFQLQSPLIVSSLAIVMFVIGLILLTDINIGSSLTRSNFNNESYSGYLNSFLTGVLAVIVASPCTAPFMGAAIGYALVQPSGTTLPIFASLGLGFAAPYMLLSANPKLISLMPRPGKWMETLKEFFAFPMFATALWLIWVFSIQSNIDGLINLLVCLLLIGLLIWVFKTFKNTIFLILITSLVLGSIITQLVSINNISNSSPAVSSNKNDIGQWYFGIEDEMQAKKQPYLINFTAAWCITCQANDKIALSRPLVKEYLIANNINYIVADWTNKDSDILKSLNFYGRSGVPLYIYWKPGMLKPDILPAILTESLLLEKLDNS
ncbi:protein-disulfide reductase DsbD family protein [Gammaproteobacteria bacterium]|nr:protein-disulfide reductase DsbD family protein [Gammaproteobacteria bacterium]